MADFGCAYIKDANMEGIVVAGGTRRGRVLNGSHLFNMATGDWEAMGDMARARTGLALVVLEARFNAGSVQICLISHKALHI